jgi:hypothetical protein
MKTLLKSSILLLLFSFSLLVFNLSCKKESTAQNTSTSIQNLGILVFAKDVGEPPTKTATLDRIDNNKNYSPENVRWAERDVQARNTRQNVNVSIDGIEKCLHDWCDHYGIAPGSVYRRLATGESMVSAITRPKAKRFR